MADTLSKIRLGTDFVADKLDLIDEIFIHRLRIGIPLRNIEGVEFWKSKFDFDFFRAYLTQQAIHRIDGALEDVSGMLEDNDLETGIFRSRELVARVIDAWCHYHGNTNPLPKWRIKILNKMNDTDYSGMILKKFWKLQFPSIVDIYHNQGSARVYIKECIAFADQIVTEIQK
jgi:hypothetical protein